MDLFQIFYSEIYSYLISEFYKDNVFLISYINHRFSIQFINNKNEYLSQNKEEKNNFEIITYYIKDNDRKMKNINIKQYLKETYNFKNMEEINSLIKCLNNEINYIKISSQKQENELSEIKKENFKLKMELKEQDKEIEKNKNQIKTLNEQKKEQDKEIEKNKNQIKTLNEQKKEQDKEIQKNKNQIKTLKENNEKQVKEMKKKINDLNNTIDELIQTENKYYQLKGRSIFKSFANYIYLIFGIKYELDNDDKLENLKEETQKLKIDFDKISIFVNYFTSLYKTQNKESHWDPSTKDINEYILLEFGNSKFTKEDIENLKTFFKDITPEKEIKDLINMDNELTHINVSKEIKYEEKASLKNDIISKINNSIKEERKEKVLKELNKIYPRVKKNK